MTINPIGVYRTSGGGWAAYDKHGRTERVGEERAQEIEAQVAKKAEG